MKLAFTVFPFIEYFYHIFRNLSSLLAGDLDEEREHIVHVGFGDAFQ